LFKVAGHWYAIAIRIPNQRFLQRHYRKQLECSSPRSTDGEHGYTRKVDFESMKIASILMSAQLLQLKMLDEQSQPTQDTKPTPNVAEL